MKYIFITGGVCSSLGKGIASASIGLLLKKIGYKVSNIKLDPYLNVDPGTMSPYRHGEVFVTDDGAETDLDLGHYERFIDNPLNKYCTCAAGQIYLSMINKERRGEYLGRDLQVVPHVTDEIKNFIKQSGKYTNADILIVEIGGTTGDIEGEVFLEAIRQLQREVKQNDSIHIHLTLLPYISASKEIKTKPTQLSIRDLRSRGLHPEIILMRSDYPINKNVIEKISLYCDVKPENAIPAYTLDCIYEVPLMLEKSNISKNICTLLNIKWKKPNINDWELLVKKIHTKMPKIYIGLAGKYTDLKDAYLSVYEAIKSASYANNLEVEIIPIDTEKSKYIEIINNKYKVNIKDIQLDGIIVPGGFGKRGIEGKIAFAQYCRENKIPYLGLCLGSQIMNIEFARNVLGLNDANSTEFDEKTKNPVIDLISEQKKIKNKGGTMRLGSYDCVLDTKSLSYKFYKQKRISERHRHRYEFNNKYRKQFEENGMLFAGIHPDKNLVEIVELKDHPFMIGVQFHPEFKSRPTKPHPLFNGFIKVIKKIKYNK